MIAQFFAWIFAVDEETRQWLAEHPAFVIIALLSYGIYDFLMYGADEEKANTELQRERRKRKK